MPPIDLDALKASQTELARARLALAGVDRKLDAGRVLAAAAERALAAARRKGDDAAILRAAKEVERTAGLVAATGRDRAGLTGQLRDRLDQLARMELDAPAEVPLLLFPVRLETRFTGQGARQQPVLRVRIYPDDIHMDLTDPGVTPEEEAAARAYWSVLFAAPDDSPITQAWGTLVAAVGRARARLVARALRPVNPGARGTGVAPEFPAVNALRKTASQPRLLPDHFRVTAMVNGRRIRARGGAVDPELRVGLMADDGSELVDRDGLTMLEGTEWLADYASALKVGMAIDVPMPGAGVTVDSLLVYGVCQSRRPAETASELAALMAAHDAGPGLHFVPQGTATNNTESEDSGWKSRRDPAPVPLTPAPAAADSNGTRLAAALGLAHALTGGMGHADAREAGAAGAMNAALWPATWGYFLNTLDQGDSRLDPAVIEDVRRFHQAHVRGRGTLPAIAVGDQPYGVMAFAGFGRRFEPVGAGRTEAGIAALLRKLWPNWLNAEGNLTRVGPGSTAEHVLKIFGQSPVSWGVRARKCAGHDFLANIDKATAQGKDAASVEALLTRLLAESLGGLSYTYGAGSLDPESRPVALPYADPARDAAFATALIEDRATGAVSSVFQALISLGYRRLKAEASPSADTPGVLRATTLIDTRLTERVIGAVMSDKPADLSEYDALIGEFTSVALPGTGGIARDLTPLMFRRSETEMALSASSTVERDWLGYGHGLRLLRARRQLADMIAGLRDLAGLAQGPDGQDLTLLVAETLDTASHRLDAWIAALASARLERMRKAQPQGITVGAFGWVFGLTPQDRSPGHGGYIAAPGLDLATTAGLLRSAYLAHNPSDGTGGAFAIDLTSARVRRALSLIEGVANGQELGALLGYDFERRLSEAGCDRFILSFRGIAPLRAGRLTDGGAPTPDPDSQALAAVNVTDMLRLLDIWGQQGAAAILARIAILPEGNDYLDPAHWKGPTDAESAAIAAAVAAADDDTDAVADLLLAESVHQMAHGNMARASAVMDASGKGDAPPPAEPDVIQTGGPGTVVTHRLIAVLPRSGGWNDAVPRALACPGLEAWAASRLPSPQRIVLGEGRDGGLVSMADTGLSALDFAALSRHPGLVSRVLRARAPLANPEAGLIQPGSARIPAGHMALAEAEMTAAALQDVLDSARPLSAPGLGPGGLSDWQTADHAVPQAVARLTSAANILQSRLVVLQGLMDAPDVLRADLMTALLSLTDFGIVMPDLASAEVADIANLALTEGVSRLERLSGMLAAPDADRIEAAATVLFGSGFHMPLPLVLAPADPEDAIGIRDFADLSPGAVERFLTDAGTVRPVIGRYQLLNLLAGISGQRPSLAVRQMVSGGDDPPDHWIGAGLPADRPSPSGAILSLLADAPDGLDPGAGITGLLLDDWTETMARRAPLGPNGPVVSQTTAGVAIHADAPGAEPPQTLLLALSPDGKRWTEDGLCDFLSDVLDLAKARLVTLETLPLAARVLPAIYTQSWSLQGEPVMDWSRIFADAPHLAMVPGLRNFTTLREV